MISTEDHTLSTLYGFATRPPQPLSDWLAAVPPEDRDRVRAAWASLEEGTTDTAEAEFRLVSDDGRVWWNHTRYMVSAREDGRVRRIIGVSTDITEQKRAEEERGKIQERYRAFFELTAIGASETGLPDGHFLRVNNALCALTGYSRDELLTMRFSDLTHPDERDASLERLRRLGDGELRHYSVEKRHVRKDGEVIWVHVEVSAGPSDHRGLPAYAIAVLQDITEQRQAEGALRENYERYQLATRSGRVSITEWDADTDSLSPEDRTLVRLVGLDPEERRKGREWIASIHPADRAQVESVWAMVADGTAGSADVEFRMRKEDGQFVWLQTRFSVKEREGERVRRILSISVDITERKRAEQEIERLADRLLQLQDEERRRIARELHDQTAQSLVASNLNLTNFVQTHPDLDEEGQRQVGESLALGRRVLEELRTLSYVLHPPALDELGLAPALVWFVDGFARRSGIAVELNIAPDLARLPSVVEGTLFRVVQESLTNVHRHAGSGKATVRLGRDVDQVTLEVIDEGHGVEAAGQRSSEDAEYLGVGIAGMRQRVRQLGGSFDVHSSSTGTTVIAVVPLDGVLEESK
jgi:PAS domain S-box-containing protein